MAFLNVTIFGDGKPTDPVPAMLAGVSSENLVHGVLLLVVVHDEAPRALVQDSLERPSLIICDSFVVR